MSVTIKILPNIITLHDILCVFLKRMRLLVANV